MDEIIWVTKDQQHININNMARPHVRNALQWCMAREHHSVIHQQRQDWPFPIDNKDGHLYRDWIAMFTARLLDPTLD